MRARMGVPEISPLDTNSAACGGEDRARTRSTCWSSAALCWRSRGDLRLARASAPALRPNASAARCCVRWRSQNFVSVPYTEGPKLAAALEQHVKDYQVDVMDLQRGRSWLPAGGTAWWKCSSPMARR